MEDVVKPARIPSQQCSAVGPIVVDVSSNHTGTVAGADALVGGVLSHLVGVFAMDVRVLGGSISNSFNSF